jgi:hypothetical protein
VKQVYLKDVFKEASTSICTFTAAALLNYCLLLPQLLQAATPEHADLQPVDGKEISK